MGKKFDILGLAFVGLSAVLTGVAYVVGKRTGSGQAYEDVTDKIANVASSIAGKTESAE
jgi:hypothetical protein